MEPRPADADVVARQLGRTPRGEFRVERRCPYGFPAVLRVHPVLRDRGRPEPFPTLFWLSCPALVEGVSRLESGGMIGALEREIASDPALAAAFDADRTAYASERASLLAPGEREELARGGLLAGVQERGVGGVRDTRTVKCLHAHYAHHVARGNALGRLIDARARPTGCPAGGVRCAGAGGA